MSGRTALITGILGQDGRLLAADLVVAGYRVVGIARPGSVERAIAVPPGLTLLELDLDSHKAVRGALHDWQPDEIYHLAAVHHSSQESSAHAGVARHDAMLTHNFLTTRTLAFTMQELGSHTHLVFAASSQMYTPREPALGISEASPRQPRTFYGHTKSWSMDLLDFMRAEHRMRASTAILFNHESVLRGPQFVTRKITQAAARASRGEDAKLELLNIGARVDWSSAADAVRALNLMARAGHGADYVVASGELHTIRELLEIAFGHVGLDWRRHTTFRADEIEPALFGDARRLREALGWQPGTGFRSMIVEMVEHDLQACGAS